MNNGEASQDTIENLFHDTLHAIADGVADTVELASTALLAKQERRK